MMQLQSDHNVTNMTTHLRYALLANKFAVCRFPAQDSVPPWASNSQGFTSITRTDDELSIVCPEHQVPGALQCERGWICFQLQGPFPFSQTGVLASFLVPLAEGEIPIFAVSTFNTDYVLVKREFQQRAISALQHAGHFLLTPSPNLPG
jgi:uncharacterized protein